MNKIYKYILDAIDYQEIEMPIDSIILKVGEQKEQICVWALVNTDLYLVNVVFRVYKTGAQISENPRLKYIGSSHLYSGNLVFHVFTENT